MSEKRERPSQEFILGVKFARLRFGLFHEGHIDKERLEEMLEDLIENGPPDPIVIRPGGMNVGQLGGPAGAPRE